MLFWAYGKEILLRGPLCHAATCLLACLQSPASVAWPAAYAARRPEYRDFCSAAV